MDAPLALYRRYRPETFAEVIGQDHVTEPLRHALAANRVNHAYLFSGPRGCGKTTCARILARALNCERAPVAEPCGACQSCRDLARGGPGSIDVIEIDAASHGGVDDARDLRERAFFAPVSSRFKVYVIDEAHMVSNQGFNALLKLVEEPPPHVKFIFATTEPEKVIGTIRSRTHHYPFRLVPPKVLGDYLATLCKAESATLEPTALPLVVRAGAGSVRDTLSVLDQLLSGAGPGGVTYELAAALLGYTPDSLLDDVIDAFAAGDGGSVFAVVDKVVETGQDPRRFAEDLLQRLRDLVIVSAVPDAIGMGLLEIPGDRAERIENQASRFGPSDLTRAADVVAQGLTELRGATAPRLLLELICARILLPGADDSLGGFQARLDRIERRLSIAAPPAGTPAPAVTTPTPADQGAPVPATAAAGARSPDPQPPDRTVADAEPQPAPAASVPRAPADTAERPVPASRTEPEVADTPPADTTLADTSPADTPPAVAALGVTDVRRLWPDVLDHVRELRRFAWVMLSQNAQVHSLEGSTLTIALVNAGARDSFTRSASDEALAAALVRVLGGTWRVETIVDPAAASGPHATASEHAPTADAPAAGSAPPQPERDLASWDEPAGAPAPEVSAPAPAPAPTPGHDPVPQRASAEAIASARRASRPGHIEQVADPDAAVDRNDPLVDVDTVSHEELLSRELGAEVIGEFPAKT